MLNLPPEPGMTGFVLLALGSAAGLLVFVLGRGRVVSPLDADDRIVTTIVTSALAVTVAAAPFTLWRVLADIRETAPVTPEHAEYVGAETKLIDGELVRSIEASIRRTETYLVRVAPDAYVEIRESLALWLGYELVPRPQTRDARRADWIVTWGATPAALNLNAGTPRLVGRNRLSDHEPVYVARAAP